MEFVVEKDGSLTDIRVVKGIGGGCDDEAILYLNAHLFKTDQSRGPALASSSKSVGSVSTTKAVDTDMSNRESFFQSTKYGQRFWMLTQFRQGACFV